MKKKVYVILGAGASAVTRKIPGEDPWARRAMTENGISVIYAHALGHALASLSLIRDEVLPALRRINSEEGR